MSILVGLTKNMSRYARAVALFVVLSTAPAHLEPRISVTVNPYNELVVAIKPAIHFRFGCQYPMTYQIGIPEGSTGLKVERRRTGTESWEVLPEKTPIDLFNAIEAVRFDYAHGRALVSAAFVGESDSLFIRITDATGFAVAPHYEGISKYYDDRRAAVTVTGDDCADWSSAWFPSILSVFRSYGLYVTAGIITGQGWCSTTTWSILQKEVDSGYVELASHSRTHPYIPYADPTGEVVGSALDIVDHVRLPPLFASGGRHFVYVWIAPYGEYDSAIDSLVSARKYIVPRLYTNVGDSTFSGWEEHQQHFAPINPTLEIGAPSWGGGTTDTNILNGTFDEIVAQGGIYHFMWHPQVINADLTKGYFLNHLEHVSSRRDIWYVNLGHLYLYRLLGLPDSSGPASASPMAERPNAFELFQNYPNPFNPVTCIEYRISNTEQVTLRVYDVLGREVAVLVNERKAPGNYTVQFNARLTTGLASGVYFGRLTAGGYIESRKMVLMK